jgi:hypothetical protein
MRPNGGCAGPIGHSVCAGMAAVGEIKLLEQEPKWC